MSDRPGVAVGYLTEPQRRRVQALSAAVLLFPSVLASHQVDIARWIITGRWPGETK